MSHSFITLLRRGMRNVRPGMAVRLLDCLELEASDRQALLTEWSKPCREEAEAWGRMEKPAEFLL